MAVSDSRQHQEPTFAAPKHPGEIGALGRYRVLKELGRGGMGAVFLGYDSALERKVALKVMLPRYAADADSRERFLREARAAAMVKSDHVVTIFDVGEEQGMPFIAMEYLLGCPLDHYLKNKGDLPLAHALRIGRETAMGLAAAHELGLVHRDIKPSNLWLEAPQGRVKLLDFGLVGVDRADVQLTSTGALVGTPAYMSPEQARGAKVDYRSDLFNLGVLLYRLTTGEMPFKGNAAMAILTSLAVDTPAPVRQLKPELPEALELLIARLLAKEPGNRLKSASEVVQALRSIELSMPTPEATAEIPSAEPAPLAISAQPQLDWEGVDATEPIRVRPIQPKPRWPAIFAGVGGFAAAFVFTLWVFTSQSSFWPAKIAAADPDRRAAEYVLSIGGAVNSMMVSGEEREIKALSDLPKEERVVLTKADLHGNERVSDAGLVNLQGCKNLMQLDLTSCKQVGDAGMTYVADLKGLMWLSLADTRVSDAGLAKFKGCTTLTALSLAGTNVGDVGVANFKECRKLKLLALHVTQVSDVGLANFSDCQELAYLDLSSTLVGDAGLVRFQGCKQLVNLNVSGTKVTPAAIAALHNALPQCKIEHDGGIFEPRQ